MDDEQRSFITTFRTFMEEVVNAAARDQKLTPLGDLVEGYLGSEISALPVITEVVAAHRLVDADLALSALATAEESDDAADGSRLIGVSHGQARHGEELPSLLNHPWVPFAPAAVDYVSVPTGPMGERRVVSFGLRMLTFQGRPVVVLQRGAQPQYG